MTDRTRFTFQAEHFIDGALNREFYNTIYVDDAASWTDVLRAFTDFMSNVYGYSIDDQIIIAKKDHINGEQEQVLLRDYY